MQKKITYGLLVPCYNAESFIDQFIGNIENLDKKFDEVIFYDDASTDNTFNVLSGKGYRVIRGEINRGPGFARNKLVKATHCQYVHFHDIDDLMDAKYLTKTSEIIQQDNDLDVVLCNVDWHDASSSQLLLKWNYSNSEINNNALAYSISNPIGGINGLYRVEKFNLSGGFNTEIKIWEDADFHVRLAATNANFFVIEETLCTSLRRSISASSNQTLAWINRSILLEEYANIYNNNATILKVIGIEAQKAASNLVILAQFTDAKQMLRLSERCNIQVPKSQSKIWRVAKFLLHSRLRISLYMLHLKIAFKKYRF